jgi:membrane-associated phospholipid phosphatase
MKLRRTFPIALAAFAAALFGASPVRAEGPDPGPGGGLDLRAGEPGALDFAAALAAPPFAGELPAGRDLAREIELAAATPSAAYKPGESWPLEVFEGADFLEEIVPVAAWRNGDYGRIALNTALPLATLASAFAFRGTDRDTLAEISRWDWAGLDRSQNNYPFLYGMVALSAASVFFPGPEDASEYSFRLRLDRATVLGLSFAVSEGVTEVLKRATGRRRPDQTSGAGRSRPSGHTTAGGVAAAFTADVLRDVFRPQEERDPAWRVVKEVGSALPYLAAAYLTLERVHGRKHFLTDALLGDAIGLLVTHAFYAWSFTRTEQGRGFVDALTVACDPEAGGVLVAVGWCF